MTQQIQTGKMNMSGIVRASLLQKLSGYINTQLIYIVAKLGLADILQAGPQSSQELATLLGVREEPLRRILQGCVIYGLVTQEIDGRFTLTPLALLLQTDAPGSLKDLAILTGEEWYSAWGKLSETLHNDCTPFTLVHGQDYYMHFAQKPEAGKRFNQFMQARTIQIAQVCIELYDFSKHRVVVDIGGGNGTLLCAVLAANPHLSGILYDTPAVVYETEVLLQTQAHTEPCKMVGGDFFVSVPDGGDLYILSQVLHNWSDEQCLQILRNCRDVMKEHGSLLLLEQVIPVHLSNHAPAVEMDLMMLVLATGRERTRIEYENMLAVAGFTLVRTEQTKRFGLTLFEAKANQQDSAST